MPHSNLPPSSAARRVACPGSRALEAKYPETIESEASREGTAAHWLAQRYLLGDYEHYETAPNGEPITKEMREGADLYEHEIKWICNDPGQLHIEERVDISNVHPECWGTPDCWLVVNDTLHVFDYKYGHGYVDVFENWQMLEYAAGITQNVECNAIQMTIIQPRCYTVGGPVRSWTISVLGVQVYIDKLKDAEFLASQENALCVPSPQCSHCLGRHACTALQRTVSRDLDVIKGYGNLELTPVQTGLELTRLRAVAKLLDARTTGLEEQARSMITRGERVVGFKLESGQGREIWIKDAAEVITLGELMGLNLAKPPEAITPLKARSLGLSDDILKAYSQKTSGKLKLIEEANASRVFKKKD